MTRRLCITLISLLAPAFALAQASAPAASASAASAASAEARPGAIYRMSTLPLPEENAADKKPPTKFSGGEDRSTLKLPEKPGKTTKENFTTEDGQRYTKVTLPNGTSYCVWAKAVQSEVRQQKTTTCPK